MRTGTGNMHRDLRGVVATAGDIAANNLESARQRSWSRFWRSPSSAVGGAAESIVEHEQMSAQYGGDLAAFDRLDLLVDELTLAEPDADRTALVAAQVACSTHRFAQARSALADAVARGAPREATDRLSLTLDQATGCNLDSVLATRRDLASRPGGWDQRIPLAALLVDLGACEEADRTYREALESYPDVSPFALAWASFQLGMLWGERMPEPQPDHAAEWYQRAIDLLPCYVKARVHLAEIHLEHGRFDGAQDLLAPAAASGDPEVRWRLADVARARGDPGLAAHHLAAARDGFEALLSKHPLAFADHGAEFYLGSGDDPERAFELARMNLANRQTLGAFEQAHAAALATGASDTAAALHTEARIRWDHLASFQTSPLNACQ